jgi:tRNA pseudouridine32 synthase/23S rRNA pseudouridine746 synthase
MCSQVNPIKKTFKPIEKNRDFWVLYKPAGISFHSDAGEAGFFEQVNQQAQAEGITRLFPVHRLDKPTSGLLIMATHEDSNRQLCQAFSEHQVEKFYLAISDKKPLKKQGMIKGDMQAARNGAWKLTKTLHNPAITQFFSYSLAPAKRLFVLKPHTGKTHQLRVAMKSLGAAIAGDQLYAGESANHYDRCYLHAYSIAFSLADKFYRFTAQPEEGQLFLTENFQQQLAEVAQPWNLPWPEMKWPEVKS